VKNGERICARWLTMLRSGVVTGAGEQRCRSPTGEARLESVLGGVHGCVCSCSGIESVC
jgi:hypothetical protein